MRTIKVPATSANLGPGFDCLGLALSPSDTFLIEPCDKDVLDNVEERFNNRDNLFLQAYRRGCEALHIQDHIHAVFQCGIPVSRGLGSSAALIVAGLAAASVLHDSALSRDDIFELASEMEGHPDNAAPAVYGGLNACMKENGRYHRVSLPLSDVFHYTVFIPDHEVSTAEARSILPDEYPRAAAAGNTAHAILLVHALETGNIHLLHEAAHDIIHEPYRSRLIPRFDQAKDCALSHNSGAFLISGSGSTCLLISDTDLYPASRKEILAYTDPSWDVFSCTISQGLEIL